MGRGSLRNFILSTLHLISGNIQRIQLNNDLLRIVMTYILSYAKAKSDQLSFEVSFTMYARYKASLQRLIYRMSVAGQRQKYYVRIQSIGTARNLYMFITLEPKNIFGRIQIKKDDDSIFNGLT